MRVSSALYFQTGLNSINRQQSDLMHIYQQVGSGRRMVTPADDPLAAAQALTLGQSQTMNARFAENRHVALRSLGEEENVLTQLISQVGGAKTRLIEAANGTLSDADRTILAEVFTEMRESILNLSNAQDASGQYLFSGSKGNTAPFELEGGEYVYKGDEHDRKIQADPTRQISAADHGGTIFMRVTPGANVFLTSGENTNTGSGVIGGVNVTDAVKAKEVASYKIEAVDENGSFAVTLIPDAANNGPVSITIDNYNPEKANTLDLGHGVTVQLSGALAAGDSFTVESAASKNGDSSLNVLNTLNEVITALSLNSDGDPALKAQQRNVLNGAMQKLDINYDNILTVRASLGARMNELDALNLSGASQGMHLETELSRLESLDYYSASTQLELRTSALEAAALAFKKIQGTSLFAINARG